MQTKFLLMLTFICVQIFQGVFFFLGVQHRLDHLHLLCYKTNYKQQMEDICSYL